MLTLALPAGSLPACAPPEHLALVDAAFARPGGPESDWMRKNLCRGCPLRLECLLLGNTLGEHGVWGGLNTNERVRAGGRSARGPGGSNGLPNLRGIDHGQGTRTHPAVPARIVKAWAREHDIPVPARGRPRAEVYAAYDAAHLPEAC